MGVPSRGTSTGPLRRSGRDGTSPTTSGPVGPPRPSCPRKTPHLHRCRLWTRVESGRILLQDLVLYGVPDTWRVRVVPPSPHTTHYQVTSLTTHVGRTTTWWSGRPAVVRYQGPRPSEQEGPHHETIWRREGGRRRVLSCHNSETVRSSDGAGLRDPGPGRDRP